MVIKLYVSVVDNNFQSINIMYFNINFNPISWKKILKNLKLKKQFLFKFNDCITLMTFPNKFF